MVLLLNLEQMLYRRVQASNNCFSLECKGWILNTCSYNNQVYLVGFILKRFENSVGGTYSLLRQFESFSSYCKLWFNAWIKHIELDFHYVVREWHVNYFKPNSYPPKSNWLILFFTIHPKMQINRPKLFIKKWLIKLKIIVHSHL